MKQRGEIRERNPQLYPDGTVRLDDVGVSRKEIGRLGERVEIWRDRD
jgi:hypothetical protein